MAEDIDFKLPVRQACAAELEAFCGEVRHGHARRVRCLQEHLEDENMGEECADQVRNDEERSSQDSRWAAGAIDGLPASSAGSIRVPASIPMPEPGS